MKFSCEKNALQSAIQNAKMALSARPSMSIMEGIHLIAEEGKIKLTCTDGSLYIRSEVEADVQQGGRVVLNSRLFSEIIRHAAPGKIQIIMDENRSLKIQSNGSRSTIAGMSDNTFPAMSTPFQNDGIHISQKILKNMISHVLFSIAQGEVKEALNGGYLELYKNEIRLVGVDGFRLSLQKWEDSFILPQGKEHLACIIPHKVLSDVSSMLEDSEELITLHIENTHIMFVIGNTTVVSTLYSGSYINYENILPKTWKTRVVTKKEEFLPAVERAGLIAQSANTNIITMRIGEGKLILTSKSEVGDVYEKLDVEIDGDPITIGFNGKYLSDIARNIDETWVEILMITPESPVIIKPRDKETATYLLMTVRLNQ